MSYAELFARSHAEFALSLFCKSAVEVLNEQGVDGVPSEDKLQKLILQKVLGENESPTPSKEILRDDVINTEPKQVEVEESEPKHVEVEESEPKHVEDDEAPKKKNVKLSSLDLKKNPLKITKNELNDNGIQVEVQVEIPVPYLSEIDYSETCQSLKVNGGLFTPCLTRPAKDSRFCKTCAKTNHKYGTLDNRSTCSMLCYEDPKGKKEVSFGTWLKKRGLKPADVIDELKAKYGITLPDEYWSVDKSKASRSVKKTVSTSSDDGGSVEGKNEAPVNSVEAEPQEPVNSVEDKDKDKHGEQKKQVRIKNTDDDESSTELKEEEVSDHEEPSVDVASLEKKNGSRMKINNNNEFVYWDGKTYIIDLEDNGLWTHDEDNTVVACVGEWDPENMCIKLD